MRLAIVARLWQIIRAQITWWRGIRVPLCPACGDIDTDDQLPGNPEPAYCLMCAEQRQRDRRRDMTRLVRSGKASSYEHAALRIANELWYVDSAKQTVIVNGRAIPMEAFLTAKDARSAWAEREAPGQL